jgi:AcrR family transcriptional regulator
MAPVRREQIVRATIRRLARDGYARLTMKTLAREARVTPSILHYYFRDKRAILVTALDTVMADVDRRVAAAQEQEGRDPRARLRALVRACLEQAVGEREFWLVFVEFWGQMLHDKRLSTVNADLYERTRRLIGRLVAEGARAGVFRRVDSHQAAAVILGLVDGVSLQLTFDPGAFTVESATHFCEDALLRYLAPERRPP